MKILALDTSTEHCSVALWRDGEVDARHEHVGQRHSQRLLPMVDELSLTRHYVELSHKTFGIDTGFYPLGSCTMKYNPKSLERLARNIRVCGVHPAQRQDTVPGFLRIMYELQAWLAEISGFDAVSIQPAAGAQGEFAGMLIFRRYFDDRGETWFCPYSAQVMGMLTYYPQLRETVDVVELPFRKPRHPVVDLLDDTRVRWFGSRIPIELNPRERSAYLLWLRSP